MLRALLCLLALLASLPAFVAPRAVLADMYQDAKNAELPAARQNLGLGTVKSEGGTPPNADVVTRFYTYDRNGATGFGGKIQFEVASSPEATEYAIEQAGLGGSDNQGATRICYSSAYAVTPVDCNYVTAGNGRHFFSSGAGALMEILYGGAGAPVNAWFRMYAAETGTKIQSWSNTAADTTLEINAKGAGATTLTNGNGAIATFNAASSSAGAIAFAPSATGGAPASIASAPYGVQVANNRIRSAQTLGTFAVPDTASGSLYHNATATGVTTFNLPVAVQGANFCFAVVVAQSVVVKAASGEKIAIGAANSAAGGQISANAPFASVCIISYQTGQWITLSTPDKTQWTVT